MVDPTPSPDTGTSPGRETPAGTPRWVKVFGIVALVVVVLFIVVLLVGGAEHGPGRHSPSSDPGGHAPPAGVTHGDQQP
ncbi:MAG: hypothetical protein WKF65_07005 [Gaiellaceae bacterium]